MYTLDFYDFYVVQQKCRDTLAEAMAHVHSEYLEEEVEDQGDVQMEMVVESANPDVPDLSDVTDDPKETSKESPENEKTEIRANKKSTGKVLVSDDSYFRWIEKCTQLTLKISLNTVILEISRGKSF